MSADQHVQSFSHVGICVTNIERSKRFYCEGLGFSEGVLLHTDDQYHALLGIPEKLMMHNQFIRRGQMMLELIQFDLPALLPGPALRSLNQLGLTHLSFRVADINIVSKSLESLGGKILHDTRVTMSLAENVSGEIIMCTDPDGTRVELMHFPDSVAFA